MNQSNQSEGQILSFLQQTVQSQNTFSNIQSLQYANQLTNNSWHKSVQDQSSHIIQSSIFSSLIIKGLISKLFFVIFNKNFLKQSPQQTIISFIEAVMKKFKSILQEDLDLQQGIGEQYFTILIQQILKQQSNDSNKALKKDDLSKKLHIKLNLYFKQNLEEFLQDQNTFKIKNLKGLMTEIGKLIGKLTDIISKTQSKSGFINIKYQPFRSKLKILVTSASQRQKIWKQNSIFNFLNGNQILSICRCDQQLQKEKKSVFKQRQECNQTGIKNLKKIQNFKTNSKNKRENMHLKYESTQKESKNIKEGTLPKIKTSTPKIDKVSEQKLKFEIRQRYFFLLIQGKTLLKQTRITKNNPNKNLISDQNKKTNAEKTQEFNYRLN